jgi:hypothetical protein
MIMPAPPRAVGAATTTGGAAGTAAGARTAVREDIFGGNEFPQMLLRVGWAPINADPLQPTA